MSEIVNLEEVATWPRDLREYLNYHYDLFLGWELGPIAGSAAEYDSAIIGMNDVLTNYSIVGWHCARLTEREVEAIKRDGMQPPSLEMLSERIDALESEDVIESRIAERLRGENQARDNNRAGMIWFCFFPPRIAGEGGIERFFRRWGGEALYNSHEDDIETGTLLMSIGQPCLVEASVPIASLKSHVGLAFNLVRRFLISRGYQTSEPVDYEDKAIKPLLAANIRRVIVFPHAEFIRLTACDNWRVALQ